MFSPQIPIETGMQQALIVVPIIFGLLSITAVGLRVLARHIAHRRLDASDYTMIAALVVNVSFCGIIAAEPFTGCGMHLTDLATRYGTAPITTYAKMTIANQILWAFAVCLSKLSILLLYMRVFTTAVFVNLARATGLLVVLLGLATVLGALLQCRPFAYNWDQTIEGGHCGDQVLSFKITASLNVVLDGVVLVLPMPYLIGLQLPLMKKLVLMATFAGGLITCIFSILRIVAIVNLDYTDLTYLAALPSIYSILEPSLVIVLACVPVLRPLLGGNYSSQGTYRGQNPEQGNNNTTQKRSLRTRTMNKAGFLAIDDNKSDSQSSEYQLRPMGPKHKAQVSSAAAEEDSDDGHGGGLGMTPGDTTTHHDIMIKSEWEVKRS